MQVYISNQYLYLPNNIQIMGESCVVKDISFLYLSTSFSLGLIYKLILCFFLGTFY